MIEFPITLTSGGSVCLPGHASALALGYAKNKSVYRLAVTATGEWAGLTIRAFWHVPGGSDPASTLVVDGYVAVPASVTAQPGNGCITFEGSDGTRTVTSADLRYRVSANSGTEDGTEPEPGTPAWQELVGAVHTDAAIAEQAKTDAQTAASEAATSAGNADKSAQEAAGSLQELKDGIASGDFKGEPGNDGKSPVVTVTDIENGHRVSITDKDGTKTIDVLNGQTGKTGATPVLTIGTVSSGDKPSADITGTPENPVLNLRLQPGPQGPAVALDTTFTNEGKAAEAKATGDAISAVKERQNILVGTETGNPLSVDDAFSAPLCGLTVYGKSTQDGTPTPDAPVPIVSAGDSGSLTVKVTGKNLIQPFEKDTQIAKNGITMDYNVASQLVHVYGTATEVADIYDARQEIPLSVKSNVTMSITVRAGKIPDGVIIQYSDFVTLGLSCTGSKPYDTGAFNRPDSPGYLKFTVNIPKGATVDFTIAAQLELGTTVTAYSPYREQPLTLPTPTGLPGIPVASGGNYTDPQGQQWVCDEVDLKRGVKVQRVNVVDLSTCVITGATNLAVTKRLAIRLPLKGRDYKIEALCNKLQFFVSFTKDTLHFYVDTFNAQVFIPIGAKNPEEGEYILFYALAAPIETPLTPAEIAAYKALTAYGPDTVVQAGDGAGIRLEYQRDVNIAIKRIEDAVASMTTT